MTEDDARALLEKVWWPDGPVCPKCGSTEVMELNGPSCRPGLKKCRKCRKQFTITVGTIMEQSHIPLSDWVYTFASMCASKKGISALQLQRELEVSYKTAWFLCHRVREAMRSEGITLKGDIEADETYVGGKPRPGDGKEHPRGRGTNKTPVQVLVERGGQAKARVVADITGKTLREAMQQHCDFTATLHTDELPVYRKLGKLFADHKYVTHRINQYVGDDGASTNTAESFFALIKRGVYGNFHHVSKKHLPRYCDEFEFRWNHRWMNDHSRTMFAILQGSGKRLLYKGTAGNATGNDTMTCRGKSLVI